MEKYKHIPTGKNYSTNGASGLVQNNTFNSPIPLWLAENSKDWEKVIEKDYEILKFIHNGSHGVEKGFIVKMKNGKLDVHHQFLPESHYLNSKCWDIHSIKRLSDGEVFTVGDKVIHTNNVRTKKATIGSFGILSNGIWFNTNIYHVPLEYIDSKVKKPLFKTENGEDIYLGDEYYVLIKENNYIFSTTASRNHCKTKGQLNFLTQKNAEEYLDNHQKRYSKQDMLNYGDHIKWYPGAITKENRLLLRNWEINRKK